MPEELDEVIASGSYAYWLADQNEINELTESVICSANPQVAREQLRDLNTRWGESIYLSFHPWRDFEDVLRMGSDSIYSAIYNFDTVIERFDSKRVLTPRELQLDTEQELEYRPPLLS